MADEDGAERSGRLMATAGECFIDFTPMEADGVTTGFELHPGGSPLNVAVTVARPAHPAALVSRVSTDFFGERIIAHLRDNGVRTDLLARGDEPTTLAFVIYAGRDAVYSFRSEGAADTLLSEADVPVDDLASLAALHFGSIGLLQPVTAASILALGARLKGRVTLTFHPNVRPSVVADWAAYAGRRRLVPGAEHVRRGHGVRGADDARLGGEHRRQAADEPRGPACGRAARGHGGTDQHDARLLRPAGPAGGERRRRLDQPVRRADGRRGDRRRERHRRDGGGARDAGPTTRVLVASVRGPRHVADLARRGVGGFTKPLGVLLGLVTHQMSDLGLRQFMADVKEARRAASRGTPLGVAAGRRERNA